MLSDLTSKQRDLADYMSELSEEAYCAGWMMGLEYALWDAVLRHSNEYGGLTLHDAERSRLRGLAEGCGGWIIFDDATEETWIPMAKWEKLFGEWVDRGRPGSL
jgi:hypothetical protein